MSGITAEQVKRLREMTGAGMMDCKSALAEANGDFDQAVEVLRKKGLKDVAKRAGKTAAEGTIGVYIHAGDQVGAIVELNCETDFVARGQEFRDTARELALHVAAMKPMFLSQSEVPQVLIEKEKEIARAQLTEAQRKNADKILPGKLSKFFQDVCFLDQSFVKEDKKTVQQIIDELSAKCGEKVIVRRFVRFEVGEGIERSVADLAADVAQTISAAG